MPVCMRDWLEEGHLAFFVLEVVAAIDTGGLHRRVGECPGRPPYEPEMMLALVLYAYCCGVRSSRRIESSCRTDAAFRLICGGLVPDHATIARFVADHERALEGLFVEGLRLCAAAGLADLSLLALDGTKIAADASLARNRDAEWIRREVAKLMALTAHKEPGPSGQPSMLIELEAAAAASLPGGRAVRLQAALAVVHAQDAAASLEAERVVQLAAGEAEQGRKPPGRKPKQPLAALARAAADVQALSARVQALKAAREQMLTAEAGGERRIKGPPPCRIRRAEADLAHAQANLEHARARAELAPSTAARVNITDPDSRIMKTKHGWVQGYNAQAIVNSQGIVLACQVSQDHGDVRLFEPMNKRLTNTLTTAGITDEIELILADAGYCSEHNLTCPGPDRLIATTKDWKQRQAARKLGQTNGPPPPDATPAEQMEHLLRTPQGAAAYKQRSPLIEGIFADRKHNRQIRSFRRRGLTAVRSEWAFIHLAANLNKLYQHQAPAIA
jgi:transposase